MARVKGLLQGFEGKLGGVVLYEVDGITYAREAVKDIKKKPTELQLFYRSKFILTSAFLRPIKKVVDFGFQNFREGMKRGFHVASSHTIKNAFSGGLEDHRLEPSLVIISSGTLPGAVNATVSWLPEGQKVLFEWEDNSGFGSARYWDQALLLLYNPEGAKSFFVLEGNLRKTKHQEIRVHEPAKHQGKLHAYIAFSYYNKRYKKYEISDSVYLGRV